MFLEGITIAAVDPCVPLRRRLGRLWLRFCGLRGQSEGRKGERRALGSMFDSVDAKHRFIVLMFQWLIG